MNGSDQSHESLSENSRHIASLRHYSLDKQSLGTRFTPWERALLRMKSIREERYAQ